MLLFVFGLLVGLVVGGSVGVVIAAMFYAARNADALAEMIERDVAPEPSTTLAKPV